MSRPGASTTAAVRDYWNQHIHDLEITTHPVGTPGFFADLDQYHFEKLHHLLRLVDFDAYRGKRVLEVGCGAGTDLVRFARGGALVTGVDLSQSAIDLARNELRAAGAAGRSARSRWRAAPVRRRHVRSRVRARRRPVHRRRSEAGGRVPPRAEAWRRSGLPGVQPRLVAERAIEGDEGAARARGRAGAEEVHAPRSSAQLLDGFRDVRIVEERFPVKSRLHKGWKGTLFNTFFVGTFNALPRALVRRFGWHLLAFCRKVSSGRRDCERCEF